MLVDTSPKLSGFVLCPSTKKFLAVGDAASETCLIPFGTQSADAQKMSMTLRLGNLPQCYVRGLRTKS
jgi:hypothetical protein